ncbi:hypothetical protein V493_02244 [Pseudogymnoascus sp. VKM F-4281 (FW-2241)]|nr:hypothetical protein V493_02244 [Pseudogymnoascus sp. VKM F-4281 (FW-2241)]
MLFPAILTAGLVSSAAASSTSHRCRANANYKGWGSMKHAFIFGDSYTTNGFNVSLTQPAPGNPLGNPPYPGWTAANGPNWPDFLTVKYNASEILTYNLAYGGATVSSSLVAPYQPTVLSLSDQVEDLFIPNYAFNGKWKSSDSVFGIFIGINDVGNSFYLGPDTVPILNKKIFAVYDGLVKELYNTGARNFVFLNVPPTDRSPLIIGQGAESAALLAKDLADFNGAIANLAAGVKKNYAGTNVFRVDAWQAFTDVLNRPAAFPATAGYKNTTEYCEAYQNGTPKQDTLDPSCGIPVNQYFWLNSLHPTSPMHDVLAEKVAKQLTRGPNAKTVLPPTYGNPRHLVGIVDITGLRAEHSWVEVGVEVQLKQASCGLYWQKANDCLTSTAMGNHNLNTAVIDEYLGNYLLIVYGVPSIVDSIDFAVPDNLVEAADSALQNRGLGDCNEPELCTAVAKTRTSPAPAAHFHIDSEMTVSIYAQSSRLWFLPCLALNQIVYSPDFILASDSRRPPPRPGRGHGAFHASAFPVYIPTAHRLLEATLWHLWDLENNPIPDPPQVPSIQRRWDFNPVFDVSSGNMTCNWDGKATASSLHAPIRAGNNITAHWENFMPDVFPNVWPHSVGPILAYMAACPGDSCEDFDGSGDVWFKIGQVGLSPEAEDLRGPWTQGGLLQPGEGPTPGYTVAIPRNLKPGKYLIRHEVIMLASRPPQFYIECAQLSITGNGTASPSGDYLASFPGTYTDEDPGLAMSQWWMGPNGSPFQPEWNTTEYPFPGPEVWSGQMRTAILPVVAAILAQQVAGHATFQQLWVNGSTCARLPATNNPVTDVSSNNMRCNGRGGVSGKCAVVAGQTVTVEMHQQNGDRSCNNEAIGGAHYGPVNVYMSKVADASTADGSTGWFKVHEDSWTKNPSGNSADDDRWGVKDLNNCCGRMNVKIPSDIAAGEYLLRAEVIALHVAGSSGGAQLYMSCYQLVVSGGGSASPATVNFPGAYKASDPGILINIHAAISSYVNPGPAVYAGGSRKVAGSACSAGAESGTTTGPPVIQTQTGTPGGGGDGGGGGCTVAKYQQCGGQDYKGCTTCALGVAFIDGILLPRNLTHGYEPTPPHIPRLAAVVTNSCHRFLPPPISMPPSLISHTTTLALGPAHKAGSHPRQALAAQKLVGFPPLLCPNTVVLSLKLDCVGPY